MKNESAMTSREQFEATWEKNNECEPMDGWESLRCDDGYTDEIIDGQWWAWQASREAVEVDLPDISDPADCYCDVYPVGSVLDALSSAGIKVKGE